MSSVYFYYFYLCTHLSPTLDGGPPTIRGAAMPGVLMRRLRRSVARQRETAPCKKSARSFPEQQLRATTTAERADAKR